MSLFLDDGDVRLYHGDALDQLALMPSESVHCAITSPPFYSLRDYNVAGQIGLEDSLDGWLASLVAVFNELKRVLRSDATFFCEIGDTYIDKQLAGAPWRLAFALQEAGWFLRSDCIWARLPPNPMPESVTDRPTKAHSYVFLLTKSARYFYDADAIREKTQEGNTPNGRENAAGIEAPRHVARQAAGKLGGGHSFPVAYNNPAGRNARSVWSIPTEPTPFAHFATFPQALVERCIKAGTSEHGCCSECGAPWRRITDKKLVEHQRVLNANPAGTGGNQQGQNRAEDGHIPGHYEITTLGWEPSCAHDAPVTPCVVCDPFMGSGTTALVARRLGRHAIGIELNAEYLAIAAKRLEQLSLLA